MQFNSGFHIKSITCMQRASRDFQWGSAGPGFKVNDKIAAHFPFSYAPVRENAFDFERRASISAYFKGVVQSIAGEINLGPESGH